MTQTVLQNIPGYRIRQRRTQHSKAPGKVEGGFDGRTLVVFAERKG